MSQFPASKYVRYKRATSFFLDWLLRARDHGHNSSKHVRLETLNEVVAKVAAEPSTLTPALLKDFPNALAACQCAITMREHVAAFFADAKHGLQHFLKLLQSWLSTLKGVAVEPHQNDDGTTSSAELESQDFNNYYEVLEVDEDYFPDEGTYVAEPTAAKNFKVDRQRLLDEAFAEDMRLEVAYFFIELAQNVFNVYNQVKKQQRTMVEATVVAKLAMDVAGSLAATLHPSLRDGLDFVEVIMQTDVESLSARMEDAYNATRKSLKNEGVFTFVPGMFMLDFLSVGITLEAFKPIIPPNLRYGIVVPRGYFGESYDEERTPHYVLPDPSFVVIFLMQQLPVLLNSLTYTKVTTFGTYEPTEDPDWRLSGCFMSVMDKYFKSREITVLTVFVCICWLKSVAALQGDGGLCRSTTLTLKHAEDLTAKFDVTVAKGAVQAVDKELHGFYRFYATIIRRSGENSHLAYTNPIVAGLTMLDHHFEYLDLASELVVVTSKLRDFGHLYNALVNEGFLQQLPFVEEILKIYDRMIFTPSRSAAAHGAYFRTYLLSSALKATALDSTLDSTLRGGANKAWVQ
ncbi:hypothetical protein PF005_g20188 [Phytophthora fragariae]|uniref:DUF6604 domain-containing protein n=1 Tax=Phytophthora fragariae TaxID=53985 RepID=A0A6A3WN11_9STRA|nr:hypothetical protein PF003_g411 [Phytophthora fragariae]KAE8928749.1 hypothetical protein PF009_g21124 [Phytophthora fragariae]KAE9087482.1 hypothetical protein PF007_g20364 [Phytophthora fragariae]KAE9116175.1 hypothetical protein PF006_g19105 [Phytophthora fragariae]KAE9188123.1 hypothetical protein PF005_g20188 [Phytophthora fragariae]